MRLRLIATLLAVSGCATITEGTSQVIAVNTSPSAATCKLDRAGQNLGTVTTPGAVTVKPKTADDIMVICDKPGYQTATFLNKSSVAAATFGNLLIGGVIGALVDGSNGSSNKYDGIVTMSLTPAAAPSVIQPSPGAIRLQPQS